MHITVKNCVGNWENSEARVEEMSKRLEKKIMNCLLANTKSQ